MVSKNENCNALRKLKFEKKRMPVAKELKTNTAFFQQYSEVTKKKDRCCFCRRMSRLEK